MPIVTGLLNGRGRIQTQDSLMPRPVQLPVATLPMGGNSIVMNQELAYQGQRDWSLCSPGDSVTLTKQAVLSCVAVVGSSEGDGGWALIWCP